MLSNRVKKGLKSEYAQRQFYMLSNLGLFYLILIALFAIPLLGTFVVVLIMGVHAYSHLILLTGLVVGVIVVFFVGRSVLRFFRRLREDGLSSFRDANRQASDGAGVAQISMFQGLLSFTVGPGQTASTPALPNGSEPLALPASPDAAPPAAAAAADPVRQIRELKEMLQDGTIEEDEFQTLKKAVIRQARGEALPDDNETEPALEFESEAYMAEEITDIDPQSRYSH